MNTRHIFPLFLLPLLLAAHQDAAPQFPLFFPEGAGVEKVSGPHPFAEGPVPDGKGGILFTAWERPGPNGYIMRYDETTGETTLFKEVPEKPNGLAFDRNGALYLCEGGARRVARIDAEGNYEVLASHYRGKRFNSPNDLSLDSQGRVYFTDPRYGDRSNMELEHESVYRLTPPLSQGGEWTLERVTWDTTRPNGVLVGPDGRTIWVGHNDYRPGMGRDLRRYTLQSDGRLGEMEIVYNFYPGRGPDGMTTDTDGNLYVMSGATGRKNQPGIYIFDKNGKFLTLKKTPDLPTNITFGGIDRSMLYLTVAPPYQRDDGSTGNRGYLCRIPTNRTGIPWFVE